MDFLREIDWIFLVKTAGVIAFWKITQFIYKKTVEDREHEKLWIRIFMFIIMGLGSLGMFVAVYLIFAAFDVFFTKISDRHWIIQLLACFSLLGFWMFARTIWDEHVKQKYESNGWRKATAYYEGLRLKKEENSQERK